MYSAITIFFSLYTLRRAKEYNIRIVYKSYILLLLSLWRSFNTITSQRACNFLVSNNKRPLRDPWHFNMHCLDHRCSRVLLKSGDCWWDHIPMSHHSLLQQFLTFTDMYMECNLTKKKTKWSFKAFWRVYLQLLFVGSCFVSYVLTMWFPIAVWSIYRRINTDILHFSSLEVLTQSPELP